jgi:hypothetical protein
MWNRSRALREAVIRALAKVGLVWVLAVLGALFMAMSAQGQHHDGGYSVPAAQSAGQQALAVTAGDAPRTAGLVLALLVLGGGATVLVVGATRSDRRGGSTHVEPEPEPEPAPDLPLALGLGLLA